MVTFNENEWMNNEQNKAETNPNQPATLGDLAELSGIARAVFESQNKLIKLLNERLDTHVAMIKALSKMILALAPKTTESDDED